MNFIIEHWAYILGLWAVASISFVIGACWQFIQTKNFEADRLIDKEMKRI